MNTSGLNPPIRRGMRFSLRALLLVVLFASIGFGGLQIMMEPARKQRAAVAALAKAGCAVNYERGCYDVPGASGSSVPRWARAVFGDDFFFTVVAADAYHQRTFDDHAAAYLQELPNLEAIELNGTQITDAGLAHLAGLTNLRELLLTDEQITDAGLSHLKRLPNLELLMLNGTQVTAAGVAHLEGLTNLEGLSLKDTKVSDAGLAHLATLPKLYGLDLSGTQVTDAGIKHLARLTNLTALVLENTQVTDGGIKQLQAALPNCKIIR
jgi:hypothetical protein